MPVTDRSISLANRHPRLRLDRRAVVAAIRVLDREFGSDHAGRSPARHRVAPAGELSIVFLTDAALAELHGAFLNDPTVTDVITFEGDPLLGVAGEICVSVDAARRQVTGIPTNLAKTRRAASRVTKGQTRQSEAFSDELTLYVVHGWLHLAGYDDLQPARKRVMRRAESRALRLLRAAKRMPVFVLR